MKYSQRLRRHGLVALLALSTPALALAQGTISGTVIERGTNSPIEGARVTITGTRLGAATDARGSYTIRGVTAGATVVRAQFIGYESVDQTVQVSNNGTVTANFSLARAPLTLSGVVVTATGEQQRRSVGTSMASVDTESIARSAAVNTQQLLAGAAPGVSVLANSGQPGAGGTVRLRGVNSVSQGNSPLIYIDGVRVFNGRTPTNVGGRQFSSPLNDIAPDDIDHIEIVRGPAATTLYGTEASGGVLQIFTKHGKDGGASWNFSTTTGFNNMGHFGPKSDTTGMFFNQCSGTLAIGDGTKFQDATCPASGSWFKNGAIKRLTLGVRGGTSGSVNYDVSGNLDDEEGVLRKSGNQRRTMRANLSFKPTKTLSIDVNQSFSRNELSAFADGNSSNGAVLNITRGSGSNFKGAGCADTTVVCVLNDSLFSSDVTNTTNHFITGATLTYQPIDAWTNRLSVGFDYNDADIRYLTPFGHLRIPLGQMFETLWNRQFISADFASTYRKALSSNISTQTSVGAQVFDSRLYSTDLQSDQFAGPGDPTLVSGSLRQITDVSQQRVINAGFFAQEVLGWKDIWFLTLGARIDGNSAFGESFGLQTYPKASLSYVISDESFFPHTIFETLKLRAAIGDAGKAPGAFDAVRTWTPVAAESGKPAFATNQVGNSELGPERTREIEAGFDATALDSRVNIQYSYFNQHTYDALIPVQQAPSLGFAGSQLINAGQLLSSGHEVQVSADLFRGNKSLVTARVGFTKLNTEAGDLGGQTLTIFALGRTVVKQGLPVPSYYGLKVMNPDDFANPIVQDNQFLGATFADRIWTPGLTVKYQRFTFDALGEWQLGGHTLNAIGYQNANLFAWQPCYDVQAKMRTAAAGDSSALASVNARDRARCTINTKIVRDYSFWVEPADFFKLRSISVTADLPQRFMRLGVNNGSLVFAARNLYTNTKYTGTDPESADQRDDTFARRDYYVFPPTRSFTLTLRLGF